MGLFDKLFSKSEPPRAASPAPRPATMPSDGLPPQIAVKGFKDLAAIQFGDDDMDLPVTLWGHFDKALSHPWINEVVLTSSRTVPPSLSQVRALFDELHAYFGTDGHGDGPFDRKDLSQWDQFRRIERRFYFYGDNLTGLRFRKDQPFTDDDYANKPCIAVVISRDVADPEQDCTVELKGWDKIKERYLG